MAPGSGLTPGLSQARARPCAAQRGLGSPPTPLSRALLCSQGHAPGTRLPGWAQQGSRTGLLWPREEPRRGRAVCPGRSVASSQGAAAYGKCSAEEKGPGRRGAGAGLGPGWVRKPAEPGGHLGSSPRQLTGSAGRPRGRLFSPPYLRKPKHNQAQSI